MKVHALRTSSSKLHARSCTAWDAHTRAGVVHRAGWGAVLISMASFVCAGLATAQRPPAQLDGAAILHRMQKLEVVGSVLYVAAHPDDENTRLISWLSNGKKVRTAYLSLTRGDGGQNLIGPELGDALGIIRTQELLEARRIDGGEQFFTRAVDFGYSKNPEETFAKWGKQEVLGDVVRVIRTFRPDVIVTRFATDGSGGHGHHTASALLANEAFDLAADPKAYPEQLKEGLEVWQAKRLFFNASTWWKKDLAEEAAKDPSSWVQVDVGGFDPLLGVSYGELAGRSRSQHKSQGFGAAETRGEQIEYLRLDKGPKLASLDLFDGVALDWSRVAGSERVRGLLREAIDDYDPRAPEKSVPRLAELSHALVELDLASGPEHAWAGLQAQAALQLILQACGVVVEATSSSMRVAAGDTLPVSLTTLQRRPSPVLEVLAFAGPAFSTIPVQGKLSPNRALSKDHAWSIPAAQTVDQPYWLAGTHAALYQPDRKLYAGIEPVVPNAASYWGSLRLEDGSTLRADRQAMYTWVDRVAGERSRPVVITPVASIGIPDGVAIVTGERATVAVEIEALTDELSGVVKAAVPRGWTVEREPQPIDKLRRGERRTVSVEFVRGSGAVRGPVHFTFSGPKGTTDRTMHVIDYPHILPQTWYTPADVMLVPEDVAVSVKTVGFIEGAGDEIPQALERLGVVVERIDPATAHASDLAKCDAIVTGIRAYNTVPALARFQPKLLEYVAAGGTLVVQYNTNGTDLVLDAKKIGPYPFALTRSRVTVEEAPPTFLAPKHALMNVPNKLDASDFEGWVQERGLYFAGDLAPEYTALIAWSDPGEDPLKGALVACDHGKGRFVYTGISLFRQLPAGVPGAYRILANLIARRAGGE
ncbi:MAG: PIG-L family deacetylase [Planctomycetota bacterium]|nr:PIG-L family deacetylase [Planctomycetota bacterium]